MTFKSFSHLPSNRKFGFTFTIFFVFLSLLFAYHDSDFSRVYFWFFIAFFIFIITLLSPNLLAPFNKAWMKLGILMGRVFSPFILGIIFFLLITPISLIIRFFGRDELNLKKSNVTSYWIDRAPSSLSNNSFYNQF